ncbi:MAG: UDP-N-acetylglucosamine-peptide N-acetylglucosaminyltransferase, partial [Selenomonadaceae bacterium]|nr:UDP-N-acetylglucosamine-peptide N-acetylglucosaminyltransferase [Selenomonadaceae bacterium]
TALGISEERFELRGFSFNYLPEYYDMDIALDTFPYPGGGTTCDALYMGVPVITLGDGSHGGDFGISLLQNIGLDIACAFSVAEYIEKAKLLAGDFELLDALHLGLRKMMENSPLMDQAAYMRELEEGYRDIWQAYLG